VGPDRGGRQAPSPAHGRCKSPGSPEDSLERRVRWTRTT
jgi:hypothetical protein